MAEVFREAGCATAGIGKWGLGPVGSTGGPNEQGFDLIFGYNCQAVSRGISALPALPRAGCRDAPTGAGGEVRCLEKDVE